MGLLQGQDLKVNGPIVDEFARRLEAIKKDIDDAGNLVKGKQAALGEHSAEEALHSFESNWHDGRERISEAMKSLAEMAHSVLGEMEKQDTSLAAAITAGQPSRPV
ncbi:hypothetical protein [Yinghuangia seranimata]|uniref:hypothetical protein n=1 Tax=Yinghuangia seranimata TaxID=408067 RepID=UPI00248CC4BF|nr:hypothetical protein [Yinghuangia seranimata]MDI2125809.1 hypothetical protein [Yinghuangia seranimata]